MPLTVRIDDGELSVPKYSPVCLFCRHWRMGTRTCTAFADAIPLSIWTGDHTHRTPYAGDGGVQFEPIDQDKMQQERGADR